MWMRNLSRAFGNFTNVWIPRFLRYFCCSINRVPLFSLYCKSFKVNQKEMKKPLVSYPTFSKFFTRELKEGARPIQNPSNDSSLVKVKNLTHSVHHAIVKYLLVVLLKMITLIVSKGIDTKSGSCCMEPLERT